MSDCSDEDSKVVVIDAGSAQCMGGFAGEDAPRSLVPSVVGIPKDAGEESISDINVRDSIVGENAQEKRDFLTLHYPIERGIVTDWDGAEKLFENIFNDLGVDSKGREVLMSEAPLNPMAHREKMMQLMFETFDLSGFFMNSSALFGLTAYGRGTGIVVDIGHGVTSVCPIAEMMSSHDAIRRQDFAGHDLTHVLSQLLYQKGLSFSSNSELDFVREIKEKVCYAAINNGENISSPLFSQSDLFTLPDGKIVKLTNERYMCGEALFNPAPYTNHSLKGLHELVHGCFMSLDSDLRRDFYCNILLTGGTSCLLGLQDRLQWEFKKLIPSEKRDRVRVIACPERKYSTWIGGSILGSLPSFQPEIVSKKDYDEYGPSIIHRIFK